MVDVQYPDIRALAEWLRDPSNAEPCATFPMCAERVSQAGVIAWHGDATANELLSTALKCRLDPLYLDQAGSDSRRSGRASGATLHSRIWRHHLHGSTQASTFRRSLGAVLWSELDLRCERPRVLDAASNARLTGWMLEHLSVATVPIDDRSRLWLIGDDLVYVLDPVLNLVSGLNNQGRRRLRKLRLRHFSLAGADADRIDRLLNLRAFAAAQDSGDEFLRRRLAQEERRTIARWGSSA